METNENTCIVNWDLYHEIHGTKLKFDFEIQYPRFKKEKFEKTKKNRDKNTKDERGVNPE